MKPSWICLALGPLFLTAALLQADEPTDPWKIPTERENFHVFLLMGQSNMVGHSQPLPEDRKPVPRILMLPTVGDMKWEPAAHPLHHRRKKGGFGLGLPFAVEYLKDKPGVVVGLIPVARGGAPIDLLRKGTPVYTDAIAKARFAQKQGIIKGVLWHQGESDTINPARADSYEKKLHGLVADLRKDLDNPRLPFVVGNLAEFYGTGDEHNQPDRVKRIDKVRGVLRALPTKVAHTGFVESTGCTSSDHHMVHFDRKSYITLGKRYAQAFETVVKKADVSSANSPSTTRAAQVSTAMFPDNLAGRHFRNRGTGRISFTRRR
ncbi:MAG: sialate O-acetylesterase [Pirellulales bacterium]|nr:sialate O-acetylesterase [Pirellulales bacterium]